MRKADFTYTIESYAGRNVIVIKDLNLGNVSVTNDIENVIDEICKSENIVKKSYMIVYMDSEGVYDGFDAERNSFIHLGQQFWKNAVSKYIELQITMKDAIRL